MAAVQAVGISMEVVEGTEFKEEWSSCGQNREKEQIPRPPASLLTLGLLEALEGGWYEGPQGCTWWR